MKINLANSIRKHRKNRKMTQEQLAEALGVSVGAVYKWEAGLSLPELNLIVEIADFFDESVDALLDYDMKDNRQGAIVDRLRTYLNNKDCSGLSEAEKALKKYPHSFDVVYESAQLYQLHGMEQHNENYLNRSIELFEASLLLLAQNRNSQIGMISINGNIAQAYLTLGNSKKAIELLTQNNVCGIYNDLIGMTLVSECKQYEEGGSILSDALLCSINSLIRTVLGYVNMYFNQDKYSEAKAYAIVGKSGSGKSSLLNLLMIPGLKYNGQILFDKTDIRNIPSETLYELISMIQQNVFIFNASIRDNVTMFQSFNQQEIERAIQRARLSNLLSERGEGYLCGENGSGLSGGEKQRISIARSLLKRSTILLADEITSALDVQTAYQVTSDILDLRGITRIMVTHSMEKSLLQRYDGIVVLKDGYIEEVGRFDDLMERKGYFYALYTVGQ